MMAAMEKLNKNSLEELTRVMAQLRQDCDASNQLCRRSDGAAITTERVVHERRWRALLEDIKCTQTWRLREDCNEVKGCASWCMKRCVRFE